MAKRIIHTASGAVTLAQYAQAWRTVKAAPPCTEYKSSLCGWWPAKREEILRQFTDGLHDRINTRGGIQPTGRKTDQDYQTRLKRDARRLRDIAARVRVYQFESTEARARFSHRLARYDD